METKIKPEMENATLHSNSAHSADSTIWGDWVIPITLITLTVIVLILINQVRG